MTDKIKAGMWNGKRQSPDTQEEACLNLLGAILERAVVDAQAGSADAIDWMTPGGEDYDWYCTICEVFKLDPDWVRERALKVQRTQRTPEYKKEYYRKYFEKNKEKLYASQAKYRAKYKAMKEAKKALTKNKKKL